MSGLLYPHASLSCLPATVRAESLQGTQCQSLGPPGVPSRLPAPSTSSSSSESAGPPPFWAGHVAREESQQREWPVSLARSIQVSSHNSVLGSEEKWRLLTKGGKGVPREEAGAAGMALCEEVGLGASGKVGPGGLGGLPVRGLTPSSGSWPRHLLWELEQVALPFCGFHSHNILNPSDEEGGAQGGSSCEQSTGCALRKAAPLASRPHPAPALSQPPVPSQSSPGPRLGDHWTPGAGQCLALLCPARVPCCRRAESGCWQVTWLCPLAF